MPTQKTFTKLQYWYPVLLWMAIIFTFSSYSGSAISNFDLLDFFIKKSIHLIEYAILWYLTKKALVETTTLSNHQTTLLSFLIIILYAGSDEFHQSFSPSRHPSIRDVIIDATGATISYLIFLNTNHFHSKQNKLKNMLKSNKA